MNISRYRDLTILEDGSKKLVIACDSSGAIGPKELDEIKVDGYTVGRALTRVVMMELISVGARPLTLIDTLAVEMEPTGKEIIRGIKAEASMISFDTEYFLNGSTEENVTVKQTGVGITAIGQVETLYTESFPEDFVICIGLPKVGSEVSFTDNDICDLPSILEIRKIKDIHEIVPIGSKGIAYELDELLKRNQLLIKPFETNIDLKKSAGPTTCVIVTGPNSCLDVIMEKVSRPVTVLGRLKMRE